MLRAETPQEQQALIGVGRRNLLINGDMKVDQRGGTHTTKSNYTLDRWKFQTDLLDQYAHSVTKSTDAPLGFMNSLAVEVTTTETSVESTEDLALTQFIEAQDCQVAALGMTLSFWVKSSVTGTFAVHVNALDVNTIFPATYSINTTNVWERKIIVIPPYENTINNDNGAGIAIRFITISGSAYVGGTANGQWKAYASSLFAAEHQANVTTSGDTWKLTGVQLELGKVATPFEHRSYGEELALCQRYFQKHGIGVSGYSNSSGSAISFAFRFTSEMRAQPTVSINNTTFAFADTFVSMRNASSPSILYNGFTQVSGSEVTGGELQITQGTTTTSSNFQQLYSEDAIYFNSEL